RERPVRRPLEHGHLRIIFPDARDGAVHVIHIDAEVMQARHVAGLAADHRHADVAVADAYRVIRTDRLLFFLRARLRAFHAENGFIKPGLAHEVLAHDGEMLDTR